MTKASAAYLLTFFSYALIHSVRTALAFTKPLLQEPPLSFSHKFLGTLDMVLLVSLAIALKTVGWAAELIGPKRFLLIGMSALSACVALTSAVQLLGATSKSIYIVLYILLGMCSCTGWPACLAIISKYYPPKQNGGKLCLWNCCSQFGDVLAMLLGTVLIHQVKLSPQTLFFSISAFLFVFFLLNYFYLPGQHQQKLNPQPAKQLIVDEGNVQNPDTNRAVKNQDVPCPTFQADREKIKTDIPSESQVKTERCVIVNSSEINNIKGNDCTPTNQVNFLNVWLIPGVAWFVLAMACIRSVNVIILYWLFLYLSQLGLREFSGVITAFWSISIFIGCVCMGYLNKDANRKYMVASLLVSALGLGFLGLSNHIGNSLSPYILVLIVSGMGIGGPAGLISSKIALMLGTNPAIKNLKGASSAIVSLMQGFGMLFSAFVVMVVPHFGVMHMFQICTVFAMAGAILIGGESFFGNRQQALVKENIQEKDQVQKTPLICKDSAI